MLSGEKARWLAVCVLLFSSSLNYLDRMILSALMPTLKAEFSLTGLQLGSIVSAFSIVYALSSPLAGLWIDHVGLRRGATAIVFVWSAAGVLTGFAGTFLSLLLCRSLLGFAESGGIPSTGKAYATYLEPKHRALGAALGQAGITVGVVGAPLLTEWFSRLYGWRSAFVVAGLLGFAWIPAWLLISSRVPALPPDPHTTGIIGSIFKDRRFVFLILANGLAMTVYSIWTTWVTLFLVNTFHLSQRDANLRFAWIPSLASVLGGLLGGWLALRSIRSGRATVPARLRIAFAASIVAAITSFAPAVASPQAAIGVISLSLAALTCMSVNYYAIPLDLFGASSAAFAISALTGSFGLMQALVSPQIGLWSEKIGWQPVCSAAAFLPLVSVLILLRVFRKQ